MKYKYNLVCSARKTVSICISPLNVISVRCPWGTKNDRIEKFLDSKESWIENCVNENSVILAENDGVVKLKQIYFNGIKFPLEFSGKNEFKNGVVNVKDIKNIKYLYIEKLGIDFLEKFKNYAQALNVSPKSVSFKDYTAKWGCCDGYNNIIFNYRLLMLPVDLQNYVAVHELCHILQHNHSDKFWKEVGKIVPDYKNKRKQLNYYRFLNSMY